MRIAFLDTLDLDYTVESAYRRPMGGSSSAVCYLAEELAKKEQDVFLFNRTTAPGLSLGVMCLPFSQVTPQLRQSLDVLVVVNLAGQGVQIKQVLDPKTRLILWTGHAHNQPSVQELGEFEERNVYDGFAFVSDWQQQQFHRTFDIRLERSRVLRNAVSPAFCDRFPDRTPILPHKLHPPTLVYTSTPFRGLNILLEVFPIIRQAVPGTVLKVFSSMKVYNQPDVDFEPLYRQCQATGGVDYIGSISQPDLAQELQSATVLAYPNTFEETSCIAAMEAMASGCWIVTSDWGALPETTAGFARLVPVIHDWDTFKARFIDETVDVLKAATRESNGSAETHLRRQVDYVNHNYIWSTRADEWIEWLSGMVLSASF